MKTRKIGSFVVCLILLGAFLTVTTTRVYANTPCPSPICSITTSSTQNTNSTTTTTISTSSNITLLQPMTIHAYGNSSCPTIIYPMGSVRFDSNVTVKDSTNKTGEWAIEFNVADVNHGYFSQTRVVEKNGSHTMTELLYRNGKLFSTEQSKIHGNSQDNFTLPDRKFTSHTTETSDFANLNIIPFNSQTQTVAFQWYGFNPPFAKGAFIIIGGANALIPANFTATEESLSFVGVNSSVVAHFDTSLRANMVLTQEQSKTTSIPLTSYQGFKNIPICGNMMTAGQSNACEDPLSSFTFGAFEQMTAD